jgi:hypothetical protein
MLQGRQRRIRTLTRLREQCNSDWRADPSWRPAKYHRRGLGKFPCDSGVASEQRKTPIYLNYHDGGLRFAGINQPNVKFHFTWL